jgi:hypothetical protein
VAPLSAGTLQSDKRSWFRPKTGLGGLLSTCRGSLARNKVAWPVAIVFACALAIEKALTVYHSNSFLAEFIPKDLKSLLSGQPVPARPAEPWPPPEIPVQKPRPEHILSVR